MPKRLMLADESQKVEHLGILASFLSFSLNTYLYMAYPLPGLSSL
jgi:hypothetical protein